MRESVHAFRLEWGETDAAGIVFYPNYFRWFDQATHELFRSLGLPVPDILMAGYAIPIIEAHGRFHRPLLYDDQLTMHSHIAEVRTRGFRVEHRVLRAGELTGEGYEVRVWVRITAQPPQSIGATDIPPDIRAVLHGE